MKSFLAQHGDSISGVLSGFDRLVFKGQLLGICYVAGMLRYLSAREVLLKDFGQHAAKVSAQLRRSSVEVAKKQQRPVIYLQSSQTNKEKVALEALAADPVQEGLVAVISCRPAAPVEPRMSLDIHKNSNSERLELVQRFRKGLHLYHYMIHPTFGWMNVRIQTAPAARLVSFYFSNLHQWTRPGRRSDGSPVSSILQAYVTNEQTTVFPGWRMLSNRKRSLTSSSLPTGLKF